MKNLIVDKFLEKCSIRQIASMLIIPKITVHDVVSVFRDTSRMEYNYFVEKLAFSIFTTGVQFFMQRAVLLN